MKLISPDILLYIFLLGLGLSSFFIFFLPRSIGFNIFIVLTASEGLIIAYYIYQTKKNKQQPICPLGSDCNAVIQSRYSKFLGIPLEYLGILYYFVVLSTSGFSFVP